VHELAGAWTCPDIFVGCSGNFTVERVLMDLDRFALHGNDVTVFSGAIGSILAGQPFAITLKPEFDDVLGWLRPYMQHPIDTAATVMLLTRMSDTMTAAGDLRDNAFNHRIYPAFERQFPQLHAATAAKLFDLKGSLATYYNGDVMDMLAEIPDRAGFICYPPFFSGDYEAMFAKLDLVLEWPRPDFEDIGGDFQEQLFDQAKRLDHWLIGSNTIWENQSQYLCGVTQTTNRGMPIYLYSATGVKRVVTPRQKIEQVGVERLRQGEKLGEKLTLHTLSEGQFQALRSQYMSEKIRPGVAMNAYAVCCDGRLIGVYALSTNRTGGMIVNPRQVYMLSDFPVAPTSYAHLAKLILFAALSNESRLLAERMVNGRVTEVKTTAFTERPSSMKYRGLFKIDSRKEREDAGTIYGDPTDDEGYGRYQINYLSPIGRWSLAEGLDQWKLRFAKTV